MSAANGTATEHFDVLIIGAGLSGVGAACHLQQRLPGKSYAVLESREAIGGTWDLFRYPGIRSDSDMFTLGYSFRPWEDTRAIADGTSIREYVQATAREYGVESKIRFGHKVLRAEWSSAEARWTLTVERGGETVEMSCDFVYACTGYYRYDEGYTPEFPGIESFGGTVIHPQHWPEDLDYSGKRVVVIGSGATAVTLVPAMAERAERVTMLQRSPTYIATLPANDRLAELLGRFLPHKAVYPVVRTKNVGRMMLSYQLSRRAPKLMRRLIRKGVEMQLPGDYDVDTHFEPRYDPWDERLCLVPGGDLFRAIRGGKADVVTDQIETFTERGIRLRSGRELEADVVITATGLNLLLLGGVEGYIDGEAVDMSAAVGYKGMMFGGIPNMAVALGYTNASWTLKCDLVSEYLCRLLAYMDEHGYKVATPRAPDAGQPTEAFIDLKSGYVLRSIDQLPKQGTSHPWRLHQNYPRDIRLLKRGPVNDEMEFAAAPVPAEPTPV